MRGLIIRIVQQFIGDKRSLALLIVVPMLVLTLMSWIFSGSTYHPKLGLINMPSTIQSKLVDKGFALQTLAASDVSLAMKEKDVDAALTFKQGELSLLLEGSDPGLSANIQLLLRKALQGDAPQSTVQVNYFYGSKNLVTFDNIGPVLIGFFAFFFVFLIGGIAFLRERTGGTMERLLASPIRRHEVVFGYVIGYAIFAVLQSLIITSYSIYVLDIYMVGSIFYVFLITLLLAMTALTLGALLSAFANNEFQMIQFIPLVVVPQMFFSGLFRLETMVKPLQWLSMLMPMRYGADALREVMIRGGGFAEIWRDVAVLGTLSLAFMLLNIVALKKQRKL
jgi:ABC-2 type transport system permease protein